MKNLLAALFVLCFSLPLFSQMNTPNNSRSRYQYQSRKDEYMAKSIRKERAGIIFLSVGAVATAGGILIIADGTRKSNDYNNNYNNYYGTDDGAIEIVSGAALTVVGVGLMCGSIPFFVGAHRSRMKAMAISLKTEKATLAYKTALSTQRYPALSLSIPLGR